MPIYLDFEEPIKELREQLEKTLEIEEVSKVDVKQTVDELQKKIKETTKEIYSNLTPWQRVQVSRHPERPYTLSYIKAITEGNFI
ncbi:MAG: acetyl-CoA carboxylase carboxyl transferase subunit alpha, partial [Flavobacteriales bacterium]|nr:acetyl-CoA carboxylase carboxyl transferase subunit alpha [Flavobacteriales bacterium]